MIGQIRLSFKLTAKGQLAKLTIHNGRNRHILLLRVGSIPKKMFCCIVGQRSKSKPL